MRLMQTNYSHNSPLIIFVSPDDNKPAGMRFGIVLLVVAKHVHAQLHSAIARQGRNLYAALHKFSCHLATNVLFGISLYFCLGSLQACFVVEEFYAVGVNAACVVRSQLL